MNRIYILFITLFFSIGSNAQQWHNYNVGLNINCITPDKDTLWIGTHGGVAKYLNDGTLLAFYTTANGLVSDNIDYICIDSLDNKWFCASAINGGGISGYEGVSKFDGATWTTYIPNDTGLNGSSLTGITVGRNNSIWCGSNSYFSKFNGTQWTDYNNYDSALYNGYAPMVDRQGNVWFGSYKFDGSTITFNNIPASLADTIGVPVAYALDTNNNLWVGIESTNGTGSSQNGTLLKFDGTNWYNYIDSIPGLSLGGTIKMAIDKQNNKWFSNYCLYSYGINGIGTYCYSPVTDSSLIGEGTIQCFNFDSHDRVWVGTDVAINYYNNYGGGVNRFDGTDWHRSYPANSPLPSGTVFSVASDSHNNKWMMVNDLLGSKLDLVKFDGNHWTIDSGSILTGESIDYSFSPKNLYIDPHDQIWIYGNGSPVIKFDGTNWQTFQDQNGNSVSPNAVIADQSGKIWFGGYQGLMAFDGNNWVTYTPAVTVDDINSLAVDINNKIWIATDSGLVSFDGVNWQAYRSTNNGVPINHIYSVAADHLGYIWIALGDSAARFDGVSNWIFYSSANSPIPAHIYGTTTITSVSVDRYNNVWLPTNSWGALKFDGTDWTSYNQLNSKISSVSIEAISTDQQGNVWFATTNGGISELVNSDTTFAAWIQYDLNICTSNTITLNPATNAGKPPYTYYWQSIGNPLSCDTCANPTATITQVSTYIVQVTDSNNNTVSDTLTVQPCYPAGLTSLTADSISLSLSPNPFSNSISLTIQKQDMKTEAVTIYNTMDETVYSNNDNKRGNSYTKTLDLGYLSSGIYFIQIVADGQRAVRKIVKD